MDRRNEGGEFRKKEFTTSEVTPHLYDNPEKTLDPLAAIQKLKMLISDLTSEKDPEKKNNLWMKFNHQLGWLIEYLRKNVLSREELLVIMDMNMKIIENMKRISAVDANSDSGRFLESEFFSELNEFPEKIRSIYLSNKYLQEIRNRTRLINDLLKIMEEDGNDYAGLLFDHVGDIFRSLDKLNGLDSPYQTSVKRILSGHEHLRISWENISKSLSRLNGNGNLSEEKISGAVIQISQFLSNMEGFLNTSYTKMVEIDRFLKSSGKK